MKIFVGTSGWAYGWNIGGDLRWYVESSGLNAVELNASFYRFPFPNQIKGWAKIGQDLRWSIKVNRLITHVRKFNSFETWKRFFELFSTLDELVDFYLFQLPPNITPRMWDKIKKFARATKLHERFALEPRNPEWFKDTKTFEDEEITFVSVSAPGLPNDIFKTSDAVYLRMHGVDAWYSYCYSFQELSDFAARVAAAKPKRAYVFFNNDHDMLNNAREMKKIFESNKSRVPHD